MKKKLSITMDSIIDEKLDTYAKDNQKVKSQVIEVAVSEYLEKEHKKMEKVEEYLKKFVDDMGKDEKVEKQKDYIDNTKPEHLEKLKDYIDNTMTDEEKYLKQFVDDMGK